MDCKISSAKWWSGLFCLGLSVLTHGYGSGWWICTWQARPYILWQAYYCDVIMGVIASQITSLAIIYSIVHAGADQRKHQSSVSLAFVRGIHRWPVNWPITRTMFPFDDVIMWKRTWRRGWNIGLLSEKVLRLKDLANLLDIQQRSSTVSRWKKNVRYIFSYVK